MTASFCIQRVDPSVRVMILSDLPRPDGTTPMPTVIADEEHVILGYYTEDHDWAIVRFVGCRSHALGPPDEDSIPGHPLHKHGLGYCDCHEVKPSPWIEAIRGTNPEHAWHDPAASAKLRHCIITFRDSLFECISQGMSAGIIDPERKLPIDEMMRVWKTPRAH